MTQQTSPSPSAGTAASAAHAAVMPLRFSANAPEMIAFLRTLGMAPLVSTTGDGFAVLAAGAGLVMVHGAAGSDSEAAPGDTDLCIAVPDADSACAAFEQAGAEVRVWDESYGRQGAVTGPRGEQIAVNETQRDLYGYRGHDGATPDPRLSVVAVRASEDMDGDAAFFARLGFSATGAGDEFFRPLHGVADAGVIGLHRPAPTDRVSRPAPAPFGDTAVVRLGFETTEDLDGLAERLRAAGTDARVVHDAVTSVHVTDPDGIVIEIHPSSAPA